MSLRGSNSHGIPSSAGILDTPPRLSADFSRTPRVPPDQSPTRATLLELVRDSADAEAWRRFEAAYRSMLLRFCRQRGLQHTDSEDVVQAVFAKLVTGLKRFEYDPTKGRFRDYLFRCVRSCIADLNSCPNAAAERVGTDADGVSPRADEALFEREWAAHHYRLAIEAVRNGCDPQSVSVFEALLAGRSVRQAAQEASMTEAAVYKVQQRMRDRLREQIERQVRDEDTGG
jgi:RNA polymerase sigma factor (sigma-70 family)